MERLTEKITNKETKEVLAYRLVCEADRLKANNKLGKYEDLEENGLLLCLPCKTNTTVFVIPTKENSLNSIVEMICLGYSIGNPSNNANLFSKNRFDKNVPKMYQPSIEDFGKTWFLTEEDALQKLNE